MNRNRDLWAEEWHFFKAFLQALEKEGISSPVLRNYESLPAQVGNDIDVFVSRAQLAKAELIFRECVALHKGVLIKKYRKDTFTAWWVRIGKAPLLHIDLFNGAFYWRGRILESDANVSNGMLRHDLGIFVPRPAHQAFSMFITSIIWGGFYKFKYGSQIQELLGVGAEKEYFDSMMKRNFDQGYPIPFEFDEEPNKKLIGDYKSILRSSVKWRWLKRFRIGELLKISRYWGWEVLSILSPSGRWCLIDENLDIREDDLPINDPLSLYGAVIEYKYTKDSWTRWLWYRIRYVQRRMARNEFILVRTSADNISRILKRRGGCADFVITSEVNRMKTHERNKEYVQKFDSGIGWEKVTRRRSY